MNQWDGERGSTGAPSNVDSIPGVERNVRINVMGRRLL